MDLFNMKNWALVHEFYKKVFFLFNLLINSWIYKHDE